MSPERDDRITILLPLKGRDLHTLRYLYHANAIRLPFQILIADGQVNPRLAECLERPGLFPNLRYRYVRYPDDATLDRFYAKMADAVSRVTTPYVMQTDNDDFLLPAGLGRYADFLDTAPDFASCGGHVPGFSIAASKGKWANLTGPIDFIRMNYGGEALREKRSDSVRDRLLCMDESARTIHVYYDLIRTPVLRAALEGALALAPADLLVHNRYIDCRVCIGGKRRFFGNVMGYARQHDTSMRVFNDSRLDDVASRLSQPQLRRDHKSAAMRLAAECGDADPDALVREIEDRFEHYLRTQLRQAERPEPMRPPLPASLHRVLRRLRHGRAFTATGMRRNLMDRLRAAKADQPYLDALAQDFASIDKVLEGSGFGDFLRRHVPELLPP